MGDLVCLAGISRQDQRNPPLGNRRLGKCDPARYPRGDRFDPAGIGAMDGTGKAKRGIARPRLLEAGDACKHPPVNFGQHHMHGNVCGESPRDAAAHPARPDVASAS